MIKYCLEKWDKNKDHLESVLRERTNLADADYSDLVKLVVSEVLNADEDEYCGTYWDVENIVEIDHGKYQGTLLYMIPLTTFQPSEDEYLLTYISYGSCTCCDTLKGIQSDLKYDTKPNDEQVSDFMSLCKDIFTNMIKPYNHGWRYDPRFDVVEWRDNMPTDWSPPPWCKECPNRIECPILDTSLSWNCPAEDIYKEKGGES